MKWKMSRTTRSSSIGAVAIAVMLAGAMSGVPGASAQTAPPAALDQAGTIVGWGYPIDVGSVSVPAADLSAGQQGTAFTEVVPGGGNGLGLTASGTVQLIGTPLTGLPGVQDFPASLSEHKIVQIAGDASGQALAVTDQGKVIVWGDLTNVWGGHFPGADQVPADLGDVVSADLAPNANWAVAVKSDGTVAAWGSDPLNYGYLTGADALTGVKSVSLAMWYGLALKQDGTVVGFGQNANGSLDLPAALSIPGNVLAVAVRANGGIALLADHSVIAWGANSTAPGDYNTVPPGLENVVAIDASPTTDLSVAADASGEVHVWGQDTDELHALQAAPTSLAGKHIAAVSLNGHGILALVTAVRAVDSPTITGTAKQGSVLTGTPGTFTGAPDSVTYQWLANGAPIPNATGTTLTLGAAQVGKKITFRSTATKGDESTTADSTPSATVTGTTTPPKPPVKAASKTKVAKVSVKKHGKQVIVAVKVSASPAASLAGKVRVVVKRGSKTVFKKTVTVSSAGKATIKLKKLKKARYVLTASYQGNAKVTASTGTKHFRVK